MRGQDKLTIDPTKSVEEQKQQESIQKKPGRFVSFLQKLYPSKPESAPSSQALETFKFDELDFHTEKGKKMLYTILRRYPLIFRAVRLKSAFAVPSIKFKYNSDSEKKVTEAFLENLHPSSGLLQLTVFLRDLYSDTTTWGTGYLDPIWNTGKTMIDGLKKTHPIEIDLLRDFGFGEGGKVKLDEKGNPKAWVQRIDGENLKEIPFCQIGYLTFNTFGDEWLGVADLEPIYQTTWRLMNIEEGIATAIFRHGFPLYDVQVSGNTEGRPPTKSQLENAADEVKGLNYKSEFVHPPNYKVTLLESFSMSKSSDYMDPFIDQIVALSDIPKFILLGTAKDLAKASAPELLKVIKPALRPSKEKLKLFFEEQILKPLMEANHIDTVPQLIIADVKLLDEDIEKEIREKIEKEIAEGKTKESGTEKEEDLTERLSKITADEESEIIKENKKKPEAFEKHKFKVAVWTHPNGHPRCLICGDEERIGGICEGRKKDLKDEEDISPTVNIPIDKSIEEELIKQGREKELEGHDKKKKKKEIIPKLPGLYMEGIHGNLLIQGIKKQIAIPKKEEKEMAKLVGKEAYIIQDDKALGLIKLRDPRLIDLNEFVLLEYAHKISNQERIERWPDETEFAVYEFELIKVFDKPLILEEIKGDLEE